MMALSLPVRQNIAKMRILEHERLQRITSRSNALVKALRHGFTRNGVGPSDLIAVEGIRMVEEALRSGLRLHAIFFRETSAEHAGRLLKQVSPKAQAILLPEAIFDGAVPTESPQGVAALISPRKSRLDEMFGDASPMVMASAGVQDPGNLGTLLRSAEAFGASGAVVLQGSVSVSNPKVVRASAGSVFRLPVVTAKFSDLLPELRRRGFRLVTTGSHKGTPIDQANLTGTLCIVVGNEGAGVPRAILQEADESIVIPHAATVDSLNAGVAASLLLYEAARQRRFS